MNSVINFVELENRVISATYRNLMGQGQGRASGAGQRRAAVQSGHDHILAIADRFAPDQAARFDQGGDLLFDGPERTRRACGAQCRFSYRLNAYYRSIFDMIQPAAI